MKNKYITSSPKETEELGKMLMNEIDKNSFVALYGDLGAGKTAFVKGMVGSFFPEAIVTSPTYNIVNTYSHNGISLYHFDMYRITDDEDLYSIGFYDYVDNGVIVCEWSENIPFAIPENYIKVTINKLSSENEREITVESFYDNSII